MPFHRFHFLLLPLALSTPLFAATPHQMSNWQRFDTPQKIADHLDGDRFMMYCGDILLSKDFCEDEWDRALASECISPDIYTLLKTVKFEFPIQGERLGFPMCNRRDELLFICASAC